MFVNILSMCVIKKTPMLWSKDLRQDWAPVVCVCVCVCGFLEWIAVVAGQGSVCLVGRAAMTAGAEPIWSVLCCAVWHWTTLGQTRTALAIQHAVWKFALSLCFCPRQCHSSHVDQMGIFIPLHLYTAFCIHHSDTNLPEPICEVSTPFSLSLSLSLSLFSYSVTLSLPK